MAYLFGAGNTDIINCGTSVGHHATAWSLFVRLKVTSANTTTRRVINFEQPSGGFNANVFINFATGTNQLFVGHSISAGGAFEGPNWTTGWGAGTEHTLVVTLGATTISLFADTDATAKVTAITAAGSDVDADQEFCIGNLAGFSNAADSTIYEVGWWPGTTLSGAEAAGIGAGTPPATPPSYYWGLIADPNALFGGQNGAVTGASVVAHSGTNLYAPSVATSVQVGNPGWRGAWRGTNRGAA